jgi:hypothetical protein
MQRVRYEYYRDVNYRSEQYRNELRGSTFIDFQVPQSIPGFRFQVDDETHRQVYDGSEFFTLDKKEKTMLVLKQPKQSDFSSLSFFVNSPVTFRKALDTIIADKTIPKTLGDTLMNNDVCHLLRFTLPSKVIGNLGNLSDITSKRAITYTLIVDKKTDLPLEVIQTNNVTPTDYVQTRFSNYQVDTFRPEEISWRYFMYVNDYKPTIRN